MILIQNTRQVKRTVMFVDNILSMEIQKIRFEKDKMLYSVLIQLITTYIRNSLNL